MEARAETPRLLTVKEVAKELRLSETTVYELLRNGELPGARRYGGTWRVDREQLIAKRAA